MTYRNPIPLYTLAFWLLALWLLASCTKADIHQRPEKADVGYVEIHPKDAHTLPAAEYYFYNVSNPQAEHIVRAGNEEGNFEGVLPVGTYHVLAVNTGASGARFQGMEHYSTATVYDTYLNGYNPTTRTGATSRADNDFLGCESIYSTILEDIEVNAKDSLRHTPTPRKLTYTVTLNFKFIFVGETQGEISAFSGALYGIYPSVQLFDGTTTYADLQQCPRVHAGFVAEQTAGGNGLNWQVNLNLFGLYKAKNGEEHTNNMDLTVTINGKEYTFTVDLTENITNILEYTGGVIPLDIPLEVELSYNQDLSVTANVKPWVPSGSGTGNVPV